jgi:hypothetical protein
VALETPISKHDREIAIRVLMQSRQVKNWVDGLITAFGIDPNTPAGHQFIEKQSRAAAERLIR